MPPRVEVRDFVSGRFQLGFQIENLRARFRIKIRPGKRVILTSDKDSPPPELDWLNQSRLTNVRDSISRGFQSSFQLSRMPPASLDR